MYDTQPLLLNAESLRSDLERNNSTLQDQLSSLRSQLAASEASKVSLQDARNSLAVRVQELERHTLDLSAQTSQVRPPVQNDFISVLVFGTLAGNPCDFLFPCQLHSKEASPVDRFPET